MSKYTFREGVIIRNPDFVPYVPDETQEEYTPPSNKSLVVGLSLSAIIWALLGFVVAAAFGVI